MVSRKGKTSRNNRVKTSPVKLQLSFEDSDSAESEGELNQSRKVKAEQAQDDSKERRDESDPEEDENGVVDENDADNNGEANGDDGEVDSEEDEGAEDMQAEHNAPGDEDLDNPQERVEHGESTKNKRKVKRLKVKVKGAAKKVNKPLTSRLSDVKQTSIVKRLQAKKKKAAAAAEAEKPVKPGTAVAAASAVIPSTSSIVLAAITACKDKKGISLMGIKKHYLTSYPDKDWNKTRLRVKTALLSALEEGSVVRTKPNGKSQGAQGMFKVNKKHTAASEEPKGVAKVVKKQRSSSKESTKTREKKTAKQNAKPPKENGKQNAKPPKENGKQNAKPPKENGKQNAKPPKENAKPPKENGKQNKKALKENNVKVVGRPPSKKAKKELEISGKENKATKRNKAVKRKVLKSQDSDSE
ncbi:histone H1-gamma, late [Procambarus clarkii]|uniref:histone H1-gamma, late n=1 Tax=Procambarus clarkii TaxID=6728 RepID=UPI0037440538